MPRRAIDRAFFATRLRARAGACAIGFIAEPYYRLIHAEADGLPGIVLDRFGDVLSCQINTAGMARLEAEFLAACRDVLAPRAIVLRNDSAGARARRPCAGELASPSASSTGRSSSSRTARVSRRSARRAEDRLVLRPARQPPLRRRLRRRRARARSLLLRRRLRHRWRRSPAPMQVLASTARRPALELAAASADAQRRRRALPLRSAPMRSSELERLRSQGERFDLVIADPPAFAQARRRIWGRALRGYRKLARLAACSVGQGRHRSSSPPARTMSRPTAFADAVRRGLAGCRSATAGSSPRRRRPRSSGASLSPGERLS